MRGEGEAKPFIGGMLKDMPPSVKRDYRSGGMYTPTATVPYIYAIEMWTFGSFEGVILHVKPKLHLYKDTDRPSR